MDDEEFISEIGFWGFAVTVVAMLCILFSRFVDGLGVLQSNWVHAFCHLARSVRLVSGRPIR